MNRQVAVIEGRVGWRQSVAGKSVGELKYELVESGMHKLGRGWGKVMAARESYLSKGKLKDKSWKREARVSWRVCEVVAAREQVAGGES